VKPRSPNRFHQLAIENTLIFRQQRQPERAGRGADQAVCGILRKSFREHCRQRSNLGRNFMDDNAGIFNDRSDAGFDCSRCAQSTVREQHGKFPKADRRDRYAARFRCFSNRGGGTARQAFGFYCQPNPDVGVEQDHLNRPSRLWDQPVALQCHQ
jgi:hypothetical protein